MSEEDEERNISPRIRIHMRDPLHINFGIITQAQRRIDNIPHNFSSFEDILTINLENIENIMMNHALEESSRMHQLERKPILITIPKVLFKELDIPAKDTICAICREKFNNDQYVSSLNCQHIFHSDCIMEWGHYKQECPLCKSELKYTSEK